jgi:hypothetical protein
LQECLRVPRRWRRRRISGEGGRSHCKQSQLDEGGAK